MTTTLLLGRCENKLKELNENSIDAIITDPPYGLSFMGKTWDYDVPSVEVWKECLRVLKPGGHMLSFSSARTYHRMVVNVEDAGFEIRDQIMWVYGSGFPKSHNLGDGWGTALKPAHEPIVLARKPFKGTVKANKAEHGTGGLNIDKSRVPFQSKEDRQESVGKNQHADYNSNGGIRVPTKGIYHGDNRPPENYNPESGRFPANFIHDGSQGVLDLFPDTISSKRSPKHNKKTEHTNTYTPAQAEYGDHNTYGDKGSAARFFYCPKTSKKERDAGLSSIEEKAFVQFQTGNGCSGKASSISEGRNTAYRNNHPTVKPIALMSYLINLVTPPGGVVLDPFMGSGSTGCAAVQDGFNFVGIEMNEDYLDIANKRINHHAL